MSKVDIYRGKKENIKSCNKKISVIIPNYNYADFIIERIDSILFQTYPIHELIILDDCSTDESPKIIKEKIEKINKEYPSIKTYFIQNEKNTGGCVFAQWQKGLKVATGDYFWIAEADDSCDCRFLETAMKMMENDSDIRLFFSDSYRINQNNIVKSKTCTDWSDMWKCGHWNSDYVADGRDEIINYLSGQIYILNVSCVVWKNEKRCLEIFKEAEKYKIAGDWYIYSRILEEGKIAYSAKPYNYYRKHDKGSASTVINRIRELNEVIEVQDRMTKKFNLDQEKIDWQIFRRNGMGFTSNKENHGTKGKIAWIVPCFEKGSGGHRTIFQNINRLVEHGYRCDMYVEDIHHEPATAIYDRLVRDYGGFKGDVYSGFDVYNDNNYDMVVATGWNTVASALKVRAPRKVYFIQDYEPWFFPMGGEYMMAENSYRHGLEGVTIGKWLSRKMHDEYGMNTGCFDFCADLSVYHEDRSIEKEDAVCLIFQPGKPRRADTVALRALQIVQKMRPQTKLYLYGSEKQPIKGIKAEHLGVITPEKCNELYNKCSVGLSMSASNPSRIPFEMMAAGTPVVELYKENNIYDLPDSACLLAEPTPEALATAIIAILDDEKLQQKMKKAGLDFMKKRSLQVGFEQFIAFIDDCMQNKKQKESKVEAIYRKEPVLASEEVLRCASEKLDDVMYGGKIISAEYTKRNIVIRVLAKGKRIVKGAYKYIREA